MKLLNKVSANTTGEAFSWPGGVGTFTVYGTFDSGTCKLQRTVNGSDWIDISGASLTANGQVNVEMGPCQIRAVLSGATAPSLSADFQ